MLQLHNLSFHYFILRYNSFAYLALEKNQFLQKKYPSLLRSPALPVIQCDSAALFTDIQIIQKNIIIEIQTILEHLLFSELG